MFLSFIHFRNHSIHVSTLVYISEIIPYMFRNHSLHFSMCLSCICFRNHSLHVSTLVYIFRNHSLHFSMFLSLVYVLEIIPYMFLPWCIYFQKSLLTCLEIIPYTSSFSSVVYVLEIIPYMFPPFVYIFRNHSLHFFMFLSCICFRNHSLNVTCMF